MKKRCVNGRILQAGLGCLCCGSGYDVGAGTKLQVLDDPVPFL
jgi:hypothetical protein